MDSIYKLIDELQVTFMTVLAFQEKKKHKNEFEIFNYNIKL